MPLQVYPSKTKEITFLASAARTTTANSGAIQIPEGASSIMFLVETTTTPSGTSPTLDLAIQISPDAGTTWLGVSRFAQITSKTSRFLIQPFVGQNVVGTEGVTEANWEMATAAATGGALVQPSVVPAQMRVLATIGGTNPSLTFYVIGLVAGVPR